MFKVANCDLERASEPVAECHYLDVTKKKGKELTLLEPVEPLIREIRGGARDPRFRFGPRLLRSHVPIQ